MGDKLLLEFKRDNFWYFIKRRRYDVGFTDYMVVNFPISSISFIKGTLNKDVFDNIVDLAVRYIVIGEKYVVEPVYVYPYIVDKITLPDKTEDGEYLISKYSAFQYYFNNQAKKGNITYKGDRFLAKDRHMEGFLNTHLEKETIKINKDAKGDKPLKFLIIYPEMGFLDPWTSRNGILFNTHFFLMELIDLESYHSLLGSPFGTLIIDNEFILPPLYPRVTLFITEDNKSRVDTFSIKDVNIVIDEKTYKHGKNAKTYIRPDDRVTPLQKGMDLVIFNGRIVGYKEGGNTPVPEGGYIIHIDSEIIPSNYRVRYHLAEDVKFAISGGPALVMDKRPFVDFGKKGLIGRSTPSSYPPAKVPFDWEGKHTSRVAIGVKGDSFTLLYASGVNEETYIPSYDSIGFTLNEMRDLMGEYADNAINLDGGGSAQVYLFGGKPLRLGDRRAYPGLEFQRPIPFGLKVCIL